MLGVWQRWASALAKRGVEPESLLPLYDETTLIGITANPPDIGSRFGWLDVEKHGDRAIYYALIDLLRELDAPGGNRDQEAAAAKAHEEWLRQTRHKRD